MTDFTTTTGITPGRNAFGDLLVDPDTLTQRERIDVVRRLAGRWQAAADRETAWFGRKVSLWLHGPADGDLTTVLGLRPPQGSRATAPAVMAQVRRDTVLLQLSTLAGGDQAAMQVLAIETPTQWAELVTELAGFRPASPSCFSKARDRLSRHTP